MSVIAIGPVQSLTILRQCGIVFIAILTIIALLTSDYTSVGLLLCIPLLPFVLYGVSRLLQGSLRAGVVVAVAIIFIESANFRVRDIADKSIDLQVGLKLLGIALIIVLGLPTFITRIRTGCAREPFLWILFISYVCLTATYAVTPLLAIVAAASLFGGFIYLWHICEVFGRQTLINTLISACFVLCLGSIVAYFFMPSLGRMDDWSDGAFISTSRLQGLFGTANAAGAAGAFGLILVWLLSDIRRRSLMFCAVTAVFGFCMLRSDNRMAVVAMAGCFLYLSFSKGHRGLKTIILALALSILVVMFYAFGDVLLDHMARSGSADEVLSGTGRTRIWAVVLQLSAEHPLFGLGYTSSGQILPKNEMLFAAAAHAHDMYLEVLFSGGIVGVGLLIASLMASIKRAAENHAHAEVGIIIFFLIYGITEPVMNGLVGFPTLSFLASGILAFSSRPHGRSEPKVGGQRVSLAYYA